MMFGADQSIEVTNANMRKPQTRWVIGSIVLLRYQLLRVVYLLYSRPTDGAVLSLSFNHIYLLSMLAVT